MHDLCEALGCQSSKTVRKKLDGALKRLGKFWRVNLSIADDYRDCLIRLVDQRSHGMK
jgi:hypothetical protein